MPQVESTAEDDAHITEAGTRTTHGADIGDDAHKENVPGRTATFSTRITDEEMDRLDAIKNEGESKADLLCRLLEEYTTLQGRVADLVSTNEHLQTQLDDISGEIEADRQLANKQVDDYVQRIEERDQQIEALKLGGGQTGVAPEGEVYQVSLRSFGSLGMKDIAEEIRDGCAGDESCIGTVAKLQQTRIEAMSKHLDRDHDTEQKELDRKLKEDLAGKDREEKEKDRTLKKSMAEDERQLKKELSYIKKGYIPKGDLDDLVDIGRIQPKNAKKSLGYAKKQAHAEADEEIPVRSGLTEGEIDEEEWDE